MPSPAAPDVAAVIRGAGLRLTRSRRAVFDAVVAAPHASADVLFRRVVASVPHTSMQSVYNALGDFVAAGLVRRIEPAGSPGRYEVRVGDNHHHLVCTGCGAVEDVDCATGSAPCLHPAETHGYAVEAAEITYWGVCATCRSSDPTTTKEGMS